MAHDQIDIEGCLDRQATLVHLWHLEVTLIHLGCNIWPLLDIVLGFREYPFEAIYMIKGVVNTYLLSAPAKHSVCALDLTQDNVSRMERTSFRS